MNVFAQQLAAQATAAEARGDVIGAEHLARQVLGQQPDDVAMLSVAGRACLARRDHDAARACFERVVTLSPKDAGAWTDLAGMRLAAGDSEGVLAIAERAHAKGARSAGLTRLRAAALGRLGRQKEAIALLRRFVQEHPRDLDALRELGELLLQIGPMEEAFAVARRLHALEPESAQGHVKMAMVSLVSRRLAEARHHAERAVTLGPDSARAVHALAGVLLDEGHFTEALRTYERAVALDPRDAEIHTGLLYCLHHLPESGRARLAEEHARWAERHTFPLVRTRAFTNLPDPERRLRIGYLSPDFREHAVMRLFKPLFEAHDRGVVQLWCYSQQPYEDAVTQRIKARADGWCKTYGLSDRQLAQRIERDGIDILVDLGGHTACGRLTAMALRPAPVQISWLGYPGPTGLPQVDARFTDEVTDPPDLERPGTERLLFIEGGMNAFRPPPAPEVFPLPAQRNGFVTFGTINRPTKLNESVVALWGAVLHACPEARLRIEHSYLKGEPGERLRAAFVAQGVAERVDLVHETAQGRHLEAYRAIDIALDPFPWNGCVTTCEALWMGVPVLAIEGRAWADRLSASVLVHAGLGDWVAKDRADYVRIAVQRARDIEGLAALRATLRERFAASPAMDGARLARGIEAHYRALWREWCTR